MLKFLKKIYESVIYKFYILTGKEEILIKPQNINLLIEIRDPIEREIFFNLSYEEKQIATLVEFSKKNEQDYFLDIGSNCGYYALFIAKTFPNTHVIAFEPIKKTYDKLIKNIHLNNLNNQIQTFNFGLSDTNNVVQMRTLIKKGFAQSGGFTVHEKNRELKTNEILLKADLKIGDEAIKYINKKLLIKIDVEGHEINVLKGLSRLINNNKIYMQIEIFHENKENIFNFLKKNDFKFVKNINGNRKNDYFFVNY
jgi:FkbM family methyltransferase